MLRIGRRPCSQQLLRAGKAISTGATPRVPVGVPTPSTDDPASSNAVQLSVLLGSSVLLQLGATAPSHRASTPCLCTARLHRTSTQYLHTNLRTTYPHRHASTPCMPGAGMIVPCLPAYAASLDLPASSVGLIVAVPAFARACLNLPAGRLADVLGRKRPMIVGSVLDAVGCLGTAMAGGLPSMAGSRLVMGP